MSIIDAWKSQVSGEKKGPHRSMHLQEEDPMFMEQIKGLRAKLEHLVDAFQYKVVAVTSSIANEGKTMLSAQLASNFVSSGRRKVLVVDVDMRKGDLAGKLGISSTPGLSEYLSGTASYDKVLRNSFQPGLYSVPAGKRVSSPPDLLAGNAFRDFIGEIRKHFDLVLLDTPPVIPVADTLGLRDLIDGFLFVYRAGMTPYSLLRQSVEEIGEKKIIGVVMNAVEQENQSYYKRYYGKYYSKNAP